MKFLHTADWHLGAKTEGKDRLYEQKLILNEIVSIADSEDVDVILIAGDVFHNSLPSSEAEDLFIEAVEKLSNDGNRVVIIIAGNHDDPKRLVTSSYFANKHNVVLVGDLKEYKVPKLSDKKAYVEESHKGYFVVKKGEECSVIACLPFPIEYRISEKIDDKEYSDQVKTWANICTSGFNKNSFNVFLSHIMVSSVKYKNPGKDDYFTSRVGDIITANANILPKADYIALGHVHTSQFIGKKDNIYYPGSIIRMFYENENRSVAIFEGNKKGLINHHLVELKTPAKMDRIKVCNDENAEEKLSNYTDRDIVELTFVQDEPVSSIYIRELRDKFPCVSRICFENLTDKKDDEEFIVNKRNLTNSELFEKFYLKKKGKTPSSDLTELFLEIMEGDDETD